MEGRVGKGCDERIQEAGVIERKITPNNQAVGISQQSTPPEGCEHIEISLQSTTEK
jgi:hypothetical protein